MTSRHAAAVGTLEKLPALEEALGSVIRGKAEAVRLALVCLLARGHLLIEDVPGVGKTTLAQTLARCLDCSFHRIQFTSDMLPSDVLGVTVYNSSQEEFDFKRGPVFTNILLADEINRTTPKTQSALLEAMNERQVTIEGRCYPLPRPVHGRRHAEPDRVPRHVPAAGIADGPLSDAHPHGLPRRRQRARNPARRRPELRVSEHQARRQRATRWTSCSSWRAKFASTRPWSTT